MPAKNEKDLFEWANFPQNFLKKVQETSRCKEALQMNVKSLDVSDPDKMERRYIQGAAKLNRLEAFILKLIIPFVRVANCRRGRYLMVKGNLILISSDITNSLAKILPSDQQLLPVSLKRKLHYRGSFMEEWVDVKKVQLYFAWFKEHNPLYADVELNEELISQFEKDTMDAATEFEEMKMKNGEWRRITVC